MIRENLKESQIDFIETYDVRKRVHILLPDLEDTTPYWRRTTLLNATTDGFTFPEFYSAVLARTKAFRAS